MRDLYDDDKIPLRAWINGDRDLAKKIETVKFIVTTTKGGKEETKPPVEAKVKVGARSFASYEFKPDPVPDELDNYKVQYKVEMQIPDQKAPTVANGQDEFTIWPNQVEVAFDADLEDDKKKVQFRVVTGDSSSEVKTSDESGKWKERIAKKAFRIELESPWCFDGAPEHKGRKRSYKVEKSPYEAEFVAPVVESAAAKTKQYVNLDTPAAGWSKAEPFGHQLEFIVGAKGDTTRKPGEKLGKAGDLVYIQVDFTPKTKRNKPKPCLLDDGLDGKAAASNDDKTWKGKVKLDKDGQAKFKVELGYAGGDICKVQVGTDDSCRDAKLEFETWRRLFYELMYCEVAKPALDGGDLPPAIRGPLKSKLEPAFIEFECSAKHEFKKAQAHAGSVVSADFALLDDTRERVLFGGGFPDRSPISFKAPDPRTMHVVVADWIFDDAPSTSLEKPRVDERPFSFEKDYMVPAKVDVAGCKWTAVVEDSYKTKLPTLELELKKVANHKQSKDFKLKALGEKLSLDYTRKPNFEPEASLGSSERDELESFVRSLVGKTSEIRDKDHVIKVRLQYIEGIKPKVREVKQVLRSAFESHKVEIPWHPGIDDDGNPLSGAVDASWFEAEGIDELTIDPPDGSDPGDLIGPMNDTTCPVDIEFNVDSSKLIDGCVLGGEMWLTFNEKYEPAAVATTLAHELAHGMGMTITDGLEQPPGCDPPKDVDHGGTYFYGNDSVTKDGGRLKGTGRHCASGVSSSDLSDGSFNDKLGNCSMWFKGSSKDKYPNFCDTCVGYMQARRVTDIRSSWLGRTGEEC